MKIRSMFLPNKLEGLRHESYTTAKNLSTVYKHFSATSSALLMVQLSLPF